MKKIILITLLTVLTATVGHAADGDEVIVDGVIYTYSSNAGAYIVTGWDGETPIQSLHIRGVVDDTDVEGIAIGAFEDIEDIIYLTIDEGIGYIGQNAFCRCYNLEVAILPEGLVAIEEEAFAFCNSLTTMVIPSTVEEIQSHAFSGCTGVTDVYFLMDDTQLDDFEGWWDGTYHSTPQEAGGMEFNTNQHTVIHVPDGMLQDYVDSQKFVAWLPLVEDDICYPLWWIVNYGVEGSEYTVADDLTAVYSDVQLGLYAKDDKHWLTPDITRTGEIDYMRQTGLMTDNGNVYDQSNWVVLRNLTDPEAFKGYIIEGNSITGTLINKKNPEIEVTDETALVKGSAATYSKNVYIPASFMGRTQLGVNNRTYAFVQPKPQEYMHVAWAIYNDADECFYLPEPQEEINTMKLKGGIKAGYELYEQPPVSVLHDCGEYAFDAINRLITDEEDESSLGRQKDRHEYTPYSDGGVSDLFIVYPLELPNAPIPTGVANVVNNQPNNKNGWYSIDGRYLGTTRPTGHGIYINGNTKVVQ